MLQFAVYVFTAIFIMAGIYQAIDLPLSDILAAARNAPDGQNKLLLFDFSLNLQEPFTMPSIMTGLTLLLLGNYGLDQDTTQRLLAAGSAKRAGKALIFAALLAVPLTFVFVTIGQLLHIFYERPEITGRAMTSLDLKSTTIFMQYILSELPSGMRGLAVTGVVAAAVSTLNSGLNSMSAVAVSDFYRPLRQSKPESHYVRAGQIAMLGFALVLLLMSCICHYWQRSTDMPLLEFALAVMTFAYAGLLGIYATVVFTKRGSTGSIIAALIVGFIAMGLGDGNIGSAIGIPEAYTELAFTWKLCVATIIAFLVARCRELPQQHPLTQLGHELIAIPAISRARKFNDNPVSRIRFSLNSQHFAALIYLQQTGLSGRSERGPDFLLATDWTIPQLGKRLIQ